MTPAKEFHNYPLAKQEPWFQVGEGSREEGVDEAPQLAGYEKVREG